MLLTLCGPLNLSHGDVLRGLVPAPLSESYNVVDLSHSFDNRTIYWDDSAYYKLNVTIYNDTRAGWFQEDVMEEAIHGGNPPGFSSALLHGRLGRDADTTG
ncbi:hypothetical protein MTO96_032214 [Rhipicephalus appendiculatus]